MYSTNKQQQTAKYTHYSTYRSRRDPSKKKTFAYCAHRQRYYYRRKFY